MPKSLSLDEIQRYARQLNLKQFGEAGQLKLKAASVLCIGMGGLGCPASLYLAAAGVGRLGLIDGDVVDLSNIHRQILFTDQDIGLPKSGVAAKRLSQVNPHVSIQSYHQFLDEKNAAKLFSEYDLIVDCSDNFDTKYLVNDTCARLGKPFVYTSIYQFEGQCAIFNAPGKPCLRCIYPIHPEPGLVANCCENGVLGATAGWFGLMQAMEALKYIAGVGESLSGYLFTANLLTNDFHKFKITKLAECTACNPLHFTNPKPRAIKSCDTKLLFDDSTDITSSELSQLLKQNDVVLLDVRETWEYILFNIGGVNIPLAQLVEHLQELKYYRQIIITCQSGMRSRKAYSLLQEAGFKNIKNLYGGLNGYNDGAVNLFKHQPILG